MTVKCTKCDKPHNDTANFCPWCGQPVVSDEQIQPNEPTPKSFRDRIETKATAIA